MSIGALNILLIEDNPGDTRLLQEMLKKKMPVRYDVECVDNLSSGLERLTEVDFDVILLDLSLPDSQGLDTFTRVNDLVPHMPIIVLTGSDDEELATKAVRQGAQDYLVKGYVEPNLLIRSIRYAIDRKQAQDELRKHRDHLEELVEERAAELKKTNQKLQQEIAERKRIEKALRESEEQLRYLSSQLLTAQENERKRIARELHDSIGQTLSAIKFGVENTVNLISDQELLRGVNVLESLVPIIQNGIDEIRSICTNLRPSLLDDLGIISTISWFCRDFQNIYSGIKIEKQIEIDENEIPYFLKIEIYRILQEAFNNAAKYSNADNIYINLKKTNGMIRLFIEDNGEGFNVNNTICITRVKGGLGLASMKERTEHTGGTFMLESSKGTGTTIQASWKIKEG